MNYNFATDIEKLESLETEMKKEIRNFSNAINDIYKVYNSLDAEKIWSGEAFDSFKTKANSYKKDLDNAVKLLNSFESILTEMSTQFTTTHKEVSELCMLDEE